MSKRNTFTSEITSTASKTSTLSETKHNNQQSSTKPTTRHSASSISPDDQNDPVETNQAVSELDVGMVPNFGGDDT
jgi:hypothetical protein